MISHSGAMTSATGVCASDGGCVAMVFIGACFDGLTVHIGSAGSAREYRGEIGATVSRTRMAQPRTRWIWSSGLGLIAAEPVCSGGTARQSCSASATVVRGWSDATTETIVELDLGSARTSAGDRADGR